jgi:hypothetical protein
MSPSASPTYYCYQKEKTGDALSETGERDEAGKLFYFCRVQQVLTWVSSALHAALSFPATVSAYYFLCHPA